jgi:hypothetical protein
MQCAGRCAPASLHRIIEHRRKFQQRQVVRHSGQVQAELPGDGRVRVPGIHLRTDEPRQLERGQPVALLVLGDLGIAICRQVANNDRNLKKPSADRSAQPLGAEVDTVPAILVGRMHDDRLKDAALLDVLSQQFERVLGELGAGVVGILVKL